MPDSTSDNSGFKHYTAEPVPPWAYELTADPADFEDWTVSATMTAYAMALSPDAYRWHLVRELAALREGLVKAYYEQRGGSKA